MFLNKPSENQGKFNAKGYQNNNEFTNIQLFFQGLQEIQNLDVQPEKPYRDVLSWEYAKPRTHLQAFVSSIWYLWIFREKSTI